MSHIHLLDDLLASTGTDAPIRSVLVGTYWTAVCSRYCGLAATFQDNRPHGSALINGTLAGLLALCQPGGLVMVLGPTTPLSPVLFNRGATILSGARVVDEAAVLRTIGRGASFRQMEGVRLVNIVKKGSEQLWNIPS